MKSSKVTIEFTEESTSGIFNTSSVSSGTGGDIRIGQDLAFALDNVPRPLLELAIAVRETFSRGEPINHPLLRAAVAYIAKWENYDACMAQGANPADLPWPDRDDEKVFVPDEYKGGKR